MSFREWWLALPKSFYTGSSKLEMLAFAASICWFVWKGKKKNTFEAWQESTELAREDNSKARQLTRNLEQRWEPPPCGVTKDNVDGAIDMGCATRGAGLVAREEKGAVVGAAVGYTPGDYRRRREASWPSNQLCQDLC